MKFLASTLLFLFCAFLSAPTIIGLVEKSCDTSVAFAMTEEESVKELKVLLFSESSSNQVIFAYGSRSRIISENLSKHDNISASIFIPPPEQA